MHAGLDTFRQSTIRFLCVKKSLIWSAAFGKAISKPPESFLLSRKIRPIKTPEKWTLPHVWKAILSGQIYMGQCDGRYTDDYAYDAAVDFKSGMGAAPALPLPGG